MENITLGQISDLLKFVIALAGSITTLIIALKKVLEKQLKPLNQSIIDLDKNQCKNYLVRFLADVERGENVDDVEITRAYDAYDHYVKDLHGNSYIHDKWNKLMKERR